MPPADVHASSEYRAHLAEVLAVRAARRAGAI
jgi:CO/xanthine dehydrogenase FAD-binding subunit